MPRMSWLGLAVMGALGATSCGGSETDLGPLTKRVEALEAALTNAKAQIATLETDKAALEAKVAALEDLTAPVTRDAEGDIVVSGVNVRIEDGMGQTRCAGSVCNGKGNLILGYNEPPMECAEDGRPCFQTLPGCTCAEATDAERTGSHNLVVGPRHRYTAGAGLIVGESNAVRQEVSSVLGGTFNEVNAQVSVVVNGTSNRITDSSGSILSGQRNTVASPYATILAGQDETSTLAYQVIPPQ